ncbi:hypothetical protein F5884DRAFT_58620 [Xylogone sp. PMI_703]|nr:hypothetical protein F5884DRAFT_58620 [Xylogone sp. PMI_703]
MTLVSAEKEYADSPFNLIETPAHAQNMKIEPMDQFVEAASLMALAHNMIIRGLNSIYRQSLYVEPKDYKSFINYASCWYEVLEAHHKSEEQEFFPLVESHAGEQGLMDGSIEQHHAFLPPLEAYKSYLQSVTNNPQDFSGSHLNSLIDAFAPALMAHLTDEISSLLSLSRFGLERLPLASIWKPIAKRSGDGLSKTGALMFFFLNIDVEYEDGMWSNWPPIPRPVRAIMVRALGLQNKSWWRFASCRYDGKMKKLHVAESQN